jgi:hypothetical protein
MREAAAKRKPAPSYASAEYIRSHAVAIIAFDNRYRQTALGQALYWNALLISFVRVHGPDLAVKVIGISLRSARGLMHLPLALSFSSAPLREAS